MKEAVTDEILLCPTRPSTFLLAGGRLRCTTTCDNAATAGERLRLLSVTTCQSLLQPQTSAKLQLIEQKALRTWVHGTQQGIFVSL